MKKIKIEVIGDSHILNFFEQENGMHKPVQWEVDDFIIKDQFGHSGAGTTIWGLHNPDSQTASGKRIKEFLEKNDVDNVAFVLGEVDIRNHIQKNLGKMSQDEGVARVITRYEDWLTNVVKPNITGKIIVFGGKPYMQDCKKVDEHVRKLVPIFEKQLKAMCMKNGWYCIESYEKLSDENGYTKPEYFGRDIHLNGKNVFYNIVLPRLKEIFSDVMEESKKK